MPAKSMIVDRLRLGVALSVMLLGLSNVTAWSQDFEVIAGPDFETLPAQQVPAPVMAAARAAAPSVVFNSAQRYWEDDELVYRVSGRLYREVWHVYVTQQGRHLKTEKYLAGD